ncbi:MAG: hypothetical protein WBP64_19955 [Nitrososphaeraceae archaeon]
MEGFQPGVIMKLFGKIYLIAFSKPRRTSVLSILSYIGLVIILIGSISDRVPMSFGQGNGGSGDGGNGGSGDGGNGGANAIMAKHGGPQCHLSHHGHTDRERCVDGGSPVCPDGSQQGPKGCTCPDGSHPDGNECPTCPDGSQQGPKGCTCLIDSISDGSGKSSCIKILVFDSKGNEIASSLAGGNLHLKLVQDNSIRVSFVPMIKACSVKVDYFQSLDNGAPAGGNNNDQTSYRISMSSDNPNPVHLKYHVRCNAGS